MRHASLVAVLLALALAGQAINNPTTAAPPRQDGTPVAAGHPLIGTWIVEETRPPAGGPPVTAAVATFFADGNALVTGFGDGERPLQGVWSAAGDRGGTFTVVGLVVGGSGESDGSLRKIRAGVEVDGTGDAFTGSYTAEILNPDGTVAFTYLGPLAGTRVAVEPPDPAATPDGGTPAAGAAIR